MRSSLLALILGVGALAAAIVTLAPANNDTRPSRADCIAGAELLWSGEEGDPVRILNQVGDVFGLILSYPVAGEGVRDRKYMYMIFTRDCAMKHQMMNEIMTIFRQNIPGFPPHRIIEERIEPSTKTLEVYGEEWSDGEMPPGLMD